VTLTETYFSSRSNNFQIAHNKLKASAEKKEERKKSVVSEGLLAWQLSQRAKQILFAHV
jgi:hypothetical protein